VHASIVIVRHFIITAFLRIAKLLSILKHYVGIRRVTQRDSTCHSEGQHLLSKALDLISENKTKHQKPKPKNIM
jgi:hypothetical protein